MTRPPPGNASMDKREGGHVYPDPCCEIEEIRSQSMPMSVSCSLSADSYSGRSLSRDSSSLSSSTGSSGGRGDDGGSSSSSPGKKAEKKRGRIFNFKLWERKTGLVDQTGRRIHDEFQEELLNLGNLKWFSLDELHLETDAFGNYSRLQADGLYHLYRGYLWSGENVIVKRYIASHRPEHVETELRAISMFRHRNIVRCIGLCSEHDVVRLVYESMPNGTLASHLDSKNLSLPWAVRYQMSLNIASAILYIHEECGRCVLHGNINPQNILLDYDFNAKLFSFEHAKFRDHDDEGKVETSLVATPVYVDPMYVKTRLYTKASDVYSFGIVLLQIATGLDLLVDWDEATQSIPSTANESDANQKKSLREWVLQMYTSRKVFDVLGKRFNRPFDKLEMERLLLAGLHCAHPDRQSRLSMREVIRYLQFGESIYNMLHKNMTLHEPDEDNEFSQQESPTYDISAVPFFVCADSPEETNAVPAHIFPDHLPESQDDISITVVHADLAPTQDIFDVGIPSEYNFSSGPTQDLNLQHIKLYTLTLHEKLKKGAHFNEVMEIIIKFTETLMMLRAPLDDWNSLVQYILRTSKEIENLKTKHKKEDISLTTQNLPSLKEDMERYTAKVDEERDELAKTNMMLSSAQDEHALLLKEKSDLERQLVELQERLTDVERRKASHGDAITTIEGRIMQHLDILDNIKLDCSILTLYDSMLSKISSFSCA